MNEQNALTHFRHDGAQFSLLQYKRKQVWFGHEIFTFIGIKEPKKAIERASLDPNHYVILSGPPLADFKSNLRLKIRLSTVYLLTLVGVLCLLFNSRKPEAKALLQRILEALEKGGGLGPPKPASSSEMNGICTLMELATKETMAVGALRDFGFTPEGGIPAAFRDRPAPSIVARMIRLGRNENPYALNYLKEIVRVPLPPELQLTFPGMKAGS